MTTATQQVSEIRTTVNVRKPDVRFSALLIYVRFVNRPDFRQRLITGRFRPVIGRPVPMLYMLQTGRFRTGRSKSGQYCPDFKRSGNCIDQTGLEPVPNRFWSIQLPERSKSGQYCPDFRRPV